MKVCKTILVVWVSAPPPSAVLIVFCLLALFVWEFFCCWSSGGRHGCWVWLFLSLVKCFWRILLYCLWILGLMKLGICFVINLGLLCICVFVFVLWPLFFVGADGIYVDPSIGMVSYTVAVMVTNSVNPLSLIQFSSAMLGFVVFSA